MKLMTLVSIVACAAFATAQTPSAQPATPAPAEKAAPAAKKAKKAPKKAKPSAEAKVQAAAPVAVAAPVAAPVAPVAAAPAAGTSTVDAKAEAAPAKPWGLSAQIYSNTDHENTQKVQTLTTLGGSYKVLPKLTLKASQTFETLTNGRGTTDATRELTKANNFRTSYSTLGLSSSLPGFAGSDALPLSVNWKIMGGESEYTTTGGYSTAYSFVETNLSLPWTISPKWSVEVGTQWRHIDAKEGLNMNRFLAIPTATYTFNDMFSVYQSAGMIYSTVDASALRLLRQRMYLETGFTVNPPVKGLSVSMNVNQDKLVAGAADAETVSGFSLYKPTDAADGNTFDTVTYEALITYAY